MLRFLSQHYCFVCTGPLQFFIASIYLVKYKCSYDLNALYETVADFPLIKLFQKYDVLDLTSFIVRVIAV